MRGDWVELLEKDKSEFDLEIDDEEFNEKYKTKKSIKNWQNKKAQVVTKHLLNLKKLKHSKLDNLEFKDLKCADYLNN